MNDRIRQHQSEVFQLVLLILMVSGIGQSKPSALAPPPRPAGLELRADFVDARVICIEGESLGAVLLELSLTNRSTRTWSYLPLLDAQKWGALDVGITQPDGSGLRAYGGPYQLWPTDPFYEQLKPGKTTHTTLSLAWFGYREPFQAGKHLLRASLRCRGWMLVTRPIEFEVIKVAPEAILSSVAIPLSAAANNPVDRRKSPFVEQIKIGDSVFLFYRRFHVAGTRRQLDVVTRITELPGKVELKVEGAYEKQKPLRLTFQDGRAKSGTTTILIDSTNGEVWDEGDDPPPKDNSPKIPPPRVIKP